MEFEEGGRLGAHYSVLLSIVKNYLGGSAVSAPFTIMPSTLRSPPPRFYAPSRRTIPPHVLLSRAGKLIRMKRRSRARQKPIVFITDWGSLPDFRHDIDAADGSAASLLYYRVGRLKTGTCLPMMISRRACRAVIQFTCHRCLVHALMPVSALIIVEH